MASTAGLQSVGTNGGVALLVTAAAAADSGVQMNEAAGFKSWTFQLIGTFTGQSVQLFGTIDPAAKFLPNGQYVPHGAVIPLTSWFNLDAPSSTAGTESNPLTTTGQVLNHSGNLVAVRAVSTGTAQTGTVTVLGFATP